MVLQILLPLKQDLTLSTQLKMGKMIIYKWFWNQIKTRFNAINPYQEYFNRLINCRLIPYETIEDILINRIDRGRQRNKVFFFITILLINQIRFGLLSFVSNKSVRSYLFEYFQNQPNNEYFHLTLFIVFLFPTLISK